MVANGREYEVDCLIFATGFEVGTSYTRRAGYEIVGRGGVTLPSIGRDGLRTLHGLTSHGFPNCFFLGFTQTAITISVPQALREQADHVTYMVKAARDAGARRSGADRRSRRRLRQEVTQPRPASASASTPNAPPATTTARARPGTGTASSPTCTARAR